MGVTGGKQDHACRALSGATQSLIYFIFLTPPPHPPPSHPSQLNVMQFNPIVRLTLSIAGDPALALDDALR